MKSNAQIEEQLMHLSPITLGEMSSIRLMNRTDMKFLTNLSGLLQLLDKVEGCYFAQDIDGRRVANYATTYWDDADTHWMFRIHHCGHRPRVKVRVRSYVDSDMHFLEIKKKNNRGKTSKKRIAVSSPEAVSQQHLGEEFLKERTGLTFQDIIPTLSNRFKRITLVNREKTERLTIDFDLHFYNHESGRNVMMDNIVIIELKRDGRVPSPILPLLRELRIKPSGFSKYCIGSAVTNPDLKQNLFKEKLVRIRKIANAVSAENAC